MPHGFSSGVCIRISLKYCLITSYPKHILGQRFILAGARGTGAATTITSYLSYLGFTCAVLMNHDYLACLAWLALWPS